MKVKLYGTTDSDEGEWRTWKEAGEEKVELRIRTISPGKEREIEFRVFGKVRHLRFDKRGAQQEYDTEKQEKASREKAAWCLVDSRGFEAEAAGPAAAAAIGQALGVEVKSGEIVALDGRWTDRLKGAIFDLFPDLVAFIGEQNRKIAEVDAREEAEVSGN